MGPSWRLSFTTRIDPALRSPVYLQIIQAVIRDIENGRLAPQASMPSSRELAGILGVNRKTVVLAYEDLIAQGWLETKSTRGTIIASSLPRQPEAPQTPASLPADAGVPCYSFATPPKRSLALPEGAGLKLDEGAPDGRLFPGELLTRAYRNAVYRTGRGNGFQYRDPRGLPALRESIAEMLRSQRGLPVTADNICITRGSQNSLLLAAQLLLQPGDAVIVEHLSYEPAIAAFKARGARILPVRLDRDGMCVEDVERACRSERVRAVFVTPHHQFPTTVPLRPERRLRLLDLARQFGFAIIEDDYDHEFHFASQPLLPMAAYALQHVIYAGSLSKLLLPALRLGYIAAPAPVIDAVAHIVSWTDGMGNRITEAAANELIETGELRRHARKTRKVYAKRRDAFAHMLDDIWGPRVEFTVPDGGLAFWLRFDADLDALEAHAASKGLRLASSRSFMVSGDAPRGLRIGFASLTSDELHQAMTMLREAAG